MDEITLRIIFQIFLAALLGALIGLERRRSQKSAGMRTYSLISMGAALFTVLSYEGVKDFTGIGFDPSRIAAQIVIGVGFLGAGLIFLRGNKVRGLTTAAGVWVAAAIGMSVGFQMYLVAFMATLLTLLILLIFWSFEKKIMGIAEEDDGGDL